MVLIMGLTGSIIFLSNSVAPALTPNNIDPESSSWYALDKNGNFARAKLNYSGTKLDLGINIDSLNTKELFTNNQLQALSDNGQISLQKNGYTWGTLKKENLNSLFFNGVILGEKNQLINRAYYKKTFTLTENRWHPASFELFDLYKIEVNILNGETYYQIKNSVTDEVIFTSLGKENVINAGESDKEETYRIFHSFKHKKEFFLFRIDAADLNPDQSLFKRKVDPYITFIAIHLKPELIL
ncbi:MAG: hypothetical protein ACNS60_20485 [Candidatus Cyclobacteriaceae bacterium M2_1C_046]